MHLLCVGTALMPFTSMPFTCAHIACCANIFIFHHSHGTYWKTEKELLAINEKHIGLSSSIFLKTPSALSQMVHVYCRQSIHRYTLSPNTQTLWYKTILFCHVWQEEGEVQQSGYGPQPKWTEYTVNSLNETNESTPPPIHPSIHPCTLECLAMMRQLDRRETIALCLLWRHLFSYSAQNTLLWWLSAPPPTTTLLFLPLLVLDIWLLFFCEEIVD